MFIEMSDKVSLYVKKSGKGMPCIFIHGGPGEGSLDFEVLGGNSLEDSIQMIYFDQRGSARSGGKIDDDYSINRIVEDIEEIRKNLGISKWIVMAHSFGGIIATNYVYKYQGFVDKLILINSTLNIEKSFESQLYYGLKLLSEYQLTNEKYDTILEGWKYVFNKLIEKNLFYNLQYKDYKNFLIVSNINNRIKKFNSNMAKQAFKNKEYFKNYTYLTKEIKIPVLIVTGNEDYAIGPNHYKSFIFPNKKVEIMQGRHMLYFENKKEFNSIIQQFINGYNH